MFPYLLIIFFTGLMALTCPVRQCTKYSSINNFFWKLTFLWLVLFIGLRHEVGADWDGYLNIFENTKDESFLLVLLFKDPAYTLINWLGSFFRDGIYIVNLVCGILFTFGLMSFCRNQPRPWLTLTVALPYLVMVVAMGYTRQAVAIGLVMLAISRLQSRGLGHYVFLIILAALFHRSAIIALFFALFVRSNRSRVLVFVGIGLMLILLINFLLINQLDYFESNYLDVNLDSAGASLRLIMGFIPIVLFLLLQKKYSLDSKTKNYWLSMAWTAFIFIPIFMFSPSSTAVDRVFLYWYPLQLYIFARLPDAFGIVGQPNLFWVVLIILYSISVMMVWLLFANFSSYWLPYRFYPLEILM